VEEGRKKKGNKSGTKKKGHRSNKSKDLQCDMRVQKSYLTKRSAKSPKENNTISGKKKKKNGGRSQLSTQKNKGTESCERENPNKKPGIFKKTTQVRGGGSDAGSKKKKAET